MFLLGLELRSFLGQDFNLRTLEDKVEEDIKLILSVYKRTKNIKPHITRTMMDRGILVPLLGTKKLIVANPLVFLWNTCRLRKLKRECLVYI